MFAPTSHSGKFLPPQNRSALCGFYSVLEDSKAVQSSPLRLNLYIKIKLEILLSPLCTGLVAPCGGCLKLRGSANGSPLGPDRVLNWLCTHNGFHPLTLTRDVSLDLLLASLGVGYSTLCGTVIPHSSLLT